LPYNRKGKKQDLTPCPSQVTDDFTGRETDNDKFEKQFKLLVKALRTGDGGRKVPPESKL